jgi:nucleotide-binding universal stress UspA family protein
MTLRKILVPLTGGDRDAPALQTAFRVASAHSSYVEGLFVRPDPSEALPFMGEGVSGTVIQDIINSSKEAANQAGERARQTFTRIAGEMGVAEVDGPAAPGQTAARFVELSGGFEDVVAGRARLSDLAVFLGGKGDSAAGVGEALQACLMDAGRPILLAPSEAPQSVGGKIVIGWDGGVEAAHAITAAKPFLLAASKVEIINVSKGELDPTLADALSDYLHLHGVESTEHLIDPGARPVGEVLLEAAERAGCDLLVMGGYGHSRIRELLLGGVTRFVISHATVPVLLAH